MYCFTPQMPAMAGPTFGQLKTGMQIASLKRVAETQVLHPPQTAFWDVCWQEGRIRNGVRTQTLWYGMCEFKLII